MWLKLSGNLLQIRVHVMYYTYKFTQERNKYKFAYKWQMLGPISDVDSLLYPADKGTSTIKIHHFELMYHTGVHYDCVVNKDTNRVCVVPPTLNGSTTYMEIQ